MAFKKHEWYTWIPDPYENADMIGDMIDLQIIVELENGTFISGHWEVKGEKDWAETIFVPDFLVKGLVANDDIEYWDFVRNLL